jgi:hypothetical protein
MLRRPLQTVKQWTVWDQWNGFKKPDIFAVRYSDGVMKLVECDSTQSDRLLPIFRRNLLPPSKNIEVFADLLKLWFFFIFEGCFLLRLLLQSWGAPSIATVKNFRKILFDWPRLPKIYLTCDGSLKPLFSLFLSALQKHILMTSAVGTLLLDRYRKMCYAEGG